MDEEIDTKTEQLLIAQIQPRELIWDKKSSNYKNSYRKNKQWDAVAAKLGYPKLKLQKKWKDLVSKYKSEAALENTWKSGDGQEDSYKSEWPLKQDEEFHNTVSNGTPAFKPSKKKLSKISSKSTAINMERKRVQKVPLAEKEVQQENEIPVDSAMTNDESLFFRTLLRHSRKIDPEHAMAFRNEVNNVVQKYAYKKHLLKPKEATDSEEECVIVEEYNIPTKKKRTSATNVSIKTEIKREIKVEPTHETADTSNKECMKQEAAVYPPMFGPMFPYAYSASMYPPFYQNQASYLQGMPGPSSMPLYGNEMIHANQMMLPYSTISQEQWHASQAGSMACSPMLSTGRSRDADTREPVPASTSMQSDHASNFQHGSTNTTSPPEDKDINEYITI